MPDASNSSNEDPERQSTDLKLDNHGLPLVPQPSRFKDDPLVSYMPRCTTAPLALETYAPKLSSEVPISYPGSPQANN
jgi:hypothetical protein